MRTSRAEKLSKRDLQSLIGKLNWACQVIYGGWFFLRRLIDRVSCLKQPSHRTRLTRDMRYDLEWWIRFLGVWNGTMPMLDNQPGVSLSTDACNVAAGAYFQGSWVYSPRLWACPLQWMIFISTIKRSWHWNQLWPHGDTYGVIVKFMYTVTIRQL